MTNAFAVLLGATGIVVAVAGIIVSILNKGRGIGYPIAGALIALSAIGAAIAISEALGRDKGPDTVQSGRN